MKGLPLVQIAIKYSSFKFKVVCVCFMDFSSVDLLFSGINSFVWWLCVRVYKNNWFVYQLLIK